MRHHTMLAILLSALLASTSAPAGKHHTDSFSWNDDGQSLSLHSNDTSGIVVDRTTPTPFHGLQAGDIIVAIDDRPIAQVSELLKALRDHRASAAKLRVRRAGNEVALNWASADYAMLVPSPPPAPPAPPPPPPPPPLHS